MSAIALIETGFMNKMPHEIKCKLLLDKIGQLNEEIRLSKLNLSLAEQNVRLLRQEYSKVLKEKSKDDALMF